MHAGRFPARNVRKINGAIHTDTSLTSIQSRLPNLSCRRQRACVLINSRARFTQNGLEEEKNAKVGKGTIVHARNSR